MLAERHSVMMRLPFFQSHAFPSKEGRGAALRALLESTKANYWKELDAETKYFLSPSNLGRFIEGTLISGITSEQGLLASGSTLSTFSKTPAQQSLQTGGTDTTSRSTKRPASSSPTGSSGRPSHQQTKLS